jgi:serine/threonine protein kinase
MTIRRSYWSAVSTINREIANELMEFIDSAANRYRCDDPIGRGGEATVYQIAGEKARIAKIYHNPQSSQETKIRWMRDHPPQDPTVSSYETGHASIAWPIDLLFDKKKRFAGYLMPRVNNAVSILEVFNPRLRSQVLPRFNERYLYRTARNLAAALGAIHRRGYVIGDLSESNILVTPQALVAFIDTDSFQVQARGIFRPIVYPCPVGKPEYTAPELQGKEFHRLKRTIDHDLFALGVLIFQVLMGGNHPFRAIWLGAGDPPPIEKRIRNGWFPYANKATFPVDPPWNVPDLETLYPPVAGLLRRCFILGHKRPGRRPSSNLWEVALTKAEKALVPCSQGHLYANHLSQCPQCQIRSSRPPHQKRVPLQPRDIRSIVERNVPAINPLPPLQRVFRWFVGWIQLIMANFRPLQLLNRRAPNAHLKRKSRQKYPAGLLSDSLTSRVRWRKERLVTWMTGMTSNAGIWMLTGAVCGAALGTWLGASAGGTVIGGVGGMFVGGKIGEVVNQTIGGVAISAVIGLIGGGFLIWNYGYSTGEVTAGALFGLLLGTLIGGLGKRVGWEIIGAFGGAILGVWIGREISQVTTYPWLAGAASGFVIWGISGFIFRGLKRLGR